MVGTSIPFAKTVFGRGLGAIVRALLLGGVALFALGCSQPVRCAESTVPGSARVNLNAYDRSGFT